MKKLISALFFMLATQTLAQNSQWGGLPPPPPPPPNGAVTQSQPVTQNQFNCTVSDSLTMSRWKVTVQNNQLTAVADGYPYYLYTKAISLPRIRNRSCTFFLDGTPQTVRFSSDEHAMSIEYLNWAGNPIRQDLRLNGSYQQNGNRYANVLPGADHQGFSYTVENLEDGSRRIGRYIGTIRSFEEVCF